MTAASVQVSGTIHVKKWPPRRANDRGPARHLPGGIEVTEVIRLGVIYALVDPRDGEIRYVGKTAQTITRRLQAHLDDARTGQWKSHKLHWLRELLHEGLLPTPIVLEECPADDLNAAEVRWLADLRERGARLTNATAGGEGMIGWTPSAETRERMRAAQIGRKHPPEVREKIGRAHRGRRHTAEHHEKIAASRRDRGISDEGRRRMGWAAGITLSPERRAQISASATGKKRGPHSPETREKQRLAALARDPSTYVSANGKKTECLRGHPFDDENTRLWRNHRICRTCMREYKRRKAAGQ